MRKTKLAVCAGLLVLSAASQATTTVTAGMQVDTAGDGGDCVFLANSVSLNTSKGVQAAFDCRLADATVGTVNRVMIGACHIGGTAKLRTVGCTADASPATTFSPAGCTSASGSVEVSGVALFTTSTAGGVITESGMGTSTCVDGTGVNSLVDALPN